jgi:hypothetical protein
MPCADDNDDAGSDAGGCMDVDAEGCAAGAEAAPEGDTEKKAAGSEEAEALPLQKTDFLEELRDYIQGDFFLGSTTKKGLKSRILSYIDDLQAQHQREAPTGMQDSSFVPEGESESSGDEDGPRAEERKAEKLRRHLEQKWSFPVLPGRRTIPGSLDFEFMRALVQVLQLEDCLTEEIYGLRERICKKMKMSSFSAGIEFENPCFPLILKDVCCPWCCASSHLDVTSHPCDPYKPGHWLCTQCKRSYDKDTVQARLVDMLETVVQAWQSQEITCKKCKHLATTLMQNNCECFGRFQARFNVDDFRLVFRILRSLVVPHKLSWLGEMLDLYEPLL